GSRRSLHADHGCLANMYRYCAILWNPADASADASARFLAGRLHRAATGWRLVLDSDGLCAFESDIEHGSCEPRLLSGECGAVFGRVFRSGRELGALTASQPFDRDESARIVSTRGRHLIERCWGRYVAVARDANTGEMFVLRDPSGGLPC